VSEGAERAAPWRPELVRVGTVGKAHGLDGSVYVDAPCGWYAFPRGETVRVAGVPRALRRRAGTDDRPLVAFDGIDDRDAAAALRGAALELPASRLPPAEADAYFHFDLVGCAAYQGERLLGHVAAVEEGVAHDVLVLDDEAPTRLPFVAAIVPNVDVGARRLEVTPELDLG
jgi:16S rRNA processing protein RimM